MKLLNLREHERAFDARSAGHHMRGRSWTDQDESGIALIATLFVLVLLAALTVAMTYSTVTNVRSSGAAYHESRAFYAAEAGAEHALAQMAIKLVDGSLSDADLASINPPTVMTGFSYPSYGASKAGAPRQETVSDGPHIGLYALVQEIEVVSRAVDMRGTTAEVILTADAAAIPVFQFGVFFEKDLELNNGPPMIFGGRVHSNGNIYISSDSALYDRDLTTPNEIYHDQKHSHDWENGIWIKKSDATYALLDAFDSRFFPDPQSFKMESCSRFDCRIRTNAFDVDSLKVPLPDGMDPIEVILPRDVGDTEQVRKAKLSWRADWYVELDINTLSATGANTCARIAIASTRSSGTIPGVPDCNPTFNWTWDAFYDGREQRFVDVLDIDIGELGNWIAGEPSGITQIFYLTFVGTCGFDPQGDGCFPVVRLINGSEISWGPFTFATDQSLYTQGDYNTVNWKPAALVSDAINILSNNWQDANQQVLVENPATETWVNAAILAGHTSTNCDHEDAGCSPSYGGGFENFQRFREDWSPGSLITYHYRGSLVSLSFSQIAVAPHNGSYYDPPLRDWAFDTRFDLPSNLPPGTPNVTQIFQVSFRPGL